MINPWHKRANELIRDPLALLPLISPQPVRQFFSGDTSSLFDRFVVVIGSPGSGRLRLPDCWNSQRYRLLWTRTIALSSNR